jgi:protein arginine kinase activator
MICDLCGENEAVVHVQQIMGGDIFEVHLCAECARKKGVPLESEGDGGFSLSDLLSGLVESLSPQSVMMDHGECPQCGTSLEDLQENEKAGCPECYTVFRSQIDFILHEYTDTIVHRGKYPEKLRAYKAILIDKEVLKKKLTEAVKREEYETAARLRDRIRELEEGPQEGGYGS